MQDRPHPEQLLSAVMRFLRDEAGPALAAAGQDALAYQARVAANMLAMAQRQAALAPVEDAQELERLRALLGLQARGPVGAEAAPVTQPAGAAGAVDAAAAEPELARLNTQLAQRIAAGELPLDDPALIDHLWRSTLAKLAVDQPSYETYRRLVAPANASRSVSPSSSLSTSPTASQPAPPRTPP